ncbi:MAG: methionyl-tRNA formyltransferase [Longimicrobiales bacterium]
MRIVFWGTPEFALPSLRALIGEDHEVAGIVTQPDRLAGRRRKVSPSPVKAIALEEGIPLAQPVRARGAGFETWLRECAPELSVVVAYGQILRPEILDLPERGSINLHASLLPDLRGAAPIQWAIARGLTTTGVTVIRMVAEMDAGPILLQVAEPIGPDERAADLTPRLSEIGAEALVETLALMEADAIDAHPQDDSRATFAPRITREHARIDWTRDCTFVGCHIRAFDDVPGAWTLHEDRELKLFRPEPEPDIAHSAAPGTVIDVERANASLGILVACASGAVWVREVQAAGRRRMTTVEWLRGRQLTEGTRLF